MNLSRDHQRVKYGEDEVLVVALHVLAKVEHGLKNSHSLKTPARALRKN